MREGASLEIMGVVGSPMDVTDFKPVLVDDRLVGYGMT
jgi:hypothetical protein